MSFLSASSCGPTITYDVSELRKTVFDVLNSSNSTEIISTKELNEELWKEIKITDQCIENSSEQGTLEKFERWI